MMNTPSKRASAIGIGLAIRLVLPIPDGTIDRADRQQVAYSYAGIVVANPVVGPVDLVQLQASIRTAVDLMGTMRSSVNTTGTLRTRIDVQGER